MDRRLQEDEQKLFSDLKSALLQSFEQGALAILKNCEQSGMSGDKRDVSIWRTSISMFLDIEKLF